jgi:hypothetical protein
MAAHTAPSTASRESSRLPPGIPQRGDGRLSRRHDHGSKRQRTAKAKREMATERLSRKQRLCPKKSKPHAPKRPHNRNGSAKPVPRKPRAKQDQKGNGRAEAMIPMRW